MDGFTNAQTAALKAAIGPFLMSAANPTGIWCYKDKGYRISDDWHYEVVQTFDELLQVAAEWREAMEQELDWINEGRDQ